MTKFLNCNYPNKVLLKSGKPKELKNIASQTKDSEVTLLVEMPTKVWFKERIGSKYYYWVIEF